MRDAAIAGVGMTPIVRRSDVASSVLAARALDEALRDADVAWTDVQHVTVGAVGIPMSAAMAVLAHMPSTGVAAMAVENASATGSSALAHAVAMVASGAVDVAAAVGYGSLETLLAGVNADAGIGGPDLAQASGLALPPVVFALTSSQRQARFGAEAANTTAVVKKNRANSAANPRAQRRKPVTDADIESSPVVASPLRAIECCPMGDGAAAVIVTSADSASERAVPVLASVTATDLWHDAGGFLPDPNITSRTVAKALDIAGRRPEDLDVVEVHDAFAIEELDYVEAIGLCAPGEAAEAMARGDFSIGGRVAVSPSGGLLGRGHPGGATGLAQVVEIVEQLRGDSGERQQPGASLGLAHMIGAGGVCVVHVFGMSDGGER